MSTHLPSSLALDRLVPIVYGRLSSSVVSSVKGKAMAEWMKKQSIRDMSLEFLQTNRVLQTIEKGYFATLTTEELGHCVLYSDVTTSTQQILLQKAFSELPCSVLYLTEKQLEGKGRGTNIWESHNGCLMYAFTNSIRHPNPNTLQFLPYLVSLAVLKTIYKVCEVYIQQFCVQSMNAKTLVNQLKQQIRLKWPNDIYYNRQLKLSGVLCQSEYHNGEFHIVNGIGVNLMNTKPTICLAEIVEKEMEKHGVCWKESQATKETEKAEKKKIEFNRMDFLSTFCNIYEPMENLFHKKGFEPFKEEYLNVWLHQNQKVTLQKEKGENEEKKEDEEVWIKGITSTGCLLAQNYDGKPYELIPDGNSLDFFHGLIKRKL